MSDSNARQKKNNKKTRAVKAVYSMLGWSDSPGSKPGQETGQAVTEAGRIDVGVRRGSVPVARSREGGQETLSGQPRGQGKGRVENGPGPKPN